MAMFPGFLDQLSESNAPSVLKAPSTRIAFFLDATAPRMRLRCLIFGFLLSLTACQSVAGPITDERPIRLSGGDQNVSTYLLSIEDDLESVVRWARPINCDSKRIVDGSQSDCFTIDRVHLGNGIPGSVRDPLDVKAILDDMKDISSVGLDDYGLMPGNEGLWVRLKQSNAVLVPVSKWKNGTSYFRLKIGEVQEIEVSPLVVPSSVFGARKATERTFHLRISVRPDLANVRACYGTRTPGSLKAYEVTPYDREIDLPFGVVSLTCASASL